MERRAFLYSIPMGFLGFKSLAVSMTPTFGSSFEGKVDPFFKLFGAKQTSLFFADIKLDSLIQRNAIPLLKLGYQFPKGSEVWTKGTHLAFTPLILETKELGILDVVLLVMRRDTPNSSWSYTGSLNGFQMESILRIPLIECFNGDDMNTLHEWVLPSVHGGKAETLGWSFKTNRGKYQTKVTIEEGQTITDAGLYEEEKIIWKEQYISKHSLCKTAPFIV
jgi:hypothetical protein